MPPEHQPIDLDPSPAETVVEFGPSRLRRWMVSGFGRNLIADRRVVPLTAALAAVALLASIVSEWQVTTVDAAMLGSGDEFGDRVVPTNVTDVGELGGAFLVGLFPLVAAVVLTMFGPPAARRWMRLSGLSVGGTLAGMLFAISVSLGGQSRVVPELYTEPSQVDFGYGRGLWCAAAGVLLAMLALYLASSPSPDAWAWRRATTDDEPQAVDEPLELTVGPAKPFTPLTANLDKSSRSGPEGPISR
ncbi:hypothetical protein [Actinoplanes sp. NPDC026619]|uniref:hypothetical protein n=1 Tax=Actinoplanes sp. NPDC026619 TaxID=3155798 RepID=UPI0034058CDC